MTEASRSPPWAAMIAAEITCVSPGAMVKGPELIIMRLSWGLPSSHPLAVTGSPEYQYVVGSPVTGFTNGEPSRSRPRM